MIMTIEEIKDLEKKLYEEKNVMSFDERRKKFLVLPKDYVNYCNRNNINKG